MDRFMWNIVAVCIIVAASFPAAAETVLFTHAAPSFIASSDIYSDPIIPEEVYISKKYIHFSEDFQADKNVRSYIDRASFMVFTIKNGKLIRDLFFILNPEGIEDNGFYQIQCDVVKKEVRSTLRIYDVRVVRISKSATRMEDVRKGLAGKLEKSVGQLSSVDMSSLYVSNPQGVKVKNLKTYIVPLVKSRGLGSIEYLSGGGGRHLFRFMICNADSEKQKVERNTSRGYFVYVLYDIVHDRIDCYYALIDYSVYIK